MERHDVDVAILSVSTPGVFLGDGADARAMARDVNDFAAQVVRDHPDRFGFFATLTLPDVDGALAELDRAFDTLGADGVVLLANSAGTYLGDKAFDPVFDELQRRQAVVFVHPSILPGIEPIDGIPAFVADFLLDTTRAAVNLARTGTLDRCPDVRFILSHAGGFVPYAASRLATAAGDGDFLTGLARLQRYHFDIALSGTPSALPSLLAFTTPDKVTFGTDFPYAPDTAVAAMTAMYEAYDLDEASPPPDRPWHRRDPVPPLRKERSMKLANHAGRAALVLDDGIADVAKASDGRFGPDLGSVYDDWDAFVDFAADRHHRDRTRSSRPTSAIRYPRHGRCSPSASTTGATPRRAGWRCPRCRPPSRSTPPAWVVPSTTSRSWAAASTGRWSWSS